MKIKAGKEEYYQAGLDANQDFYGRGVYTYLERWADLMEAKIQNGVDPEAVIVNHAERLSHQADTDGITGFMYGCAVAILSEVWEYGDILRMWHNKEYDYDGNGVVNPAILTISPNRR